MAGTRFSALTDFRPEKNRFLDRAKTVYLKATHKTEDITFWWIEQRGIRGRNAYPCACQLPGQAARISGHLTKKPAQRSTNSGRR